jgi:predicted dehydrogenase
MKKKVSIIGTTRITSHHIIAARKAGFQIFSISATRENSKYLVSLAKKNNIKKKFFSWKECINQSLKFDKKISFIITAPTVKNKSLLDYILKFNSKILIEKPIFENFYEFQNLKKNKKNIFVGYNRAFYRNIIYLKDKIKNKKNLNVICNIPEINKSFISSNSCHIFSILYYLFGNLFLKKKNINKNYINVSLNSKSAEINIFFNFRASENFSVKIYDKEKIYKLSPIETLNIYKGMKVLNINNQNFYEPIKVYNKTLKSNKIKPGFLEQYLAFSKFIDNGKVFNDIKFAEKIQKLIFEILK